jgi:hypothetical protein
LKPAILCLTDRSTNAICLDWTKPRSVIGSRFCNPKFSPTLTAKLIMPKTRDSIGKVPPPSMRKYLARALATLQSVKPPVQRPPTVVNSPEYWLGQIAGLADLEARNGLTRNEAMKAIHAVLNEMKQVCR